MNFTAYKRRLPVGGPAEKALKSALTQKIEEARMLKGRKRITFVFEGLVITVDRNSKVEPFYEYWVSRLLDAHVATLGKKITRVRYTWAPEKQKPSEEDGCVLYFPRL